MKLNRAAFIIFSIVLVDQVVKVLVKTSMFLGEEFPVLGNWFLIHFTENNGMAFGMEFAGAYGKLILSLLRLFAVAGISYVLYYVCKKNYKSGIVVSIALILAGALGNIIDTVFYGVIFGYEQYLFGRVVDMFYFPLIESAFPQWFPIWGGEDFIFFRPVFNIADASITIGVFNILLFQRSFFSSEISSLGDTETDSDEEIVESSVNSSTAGSA